MHAVMKAPALLHRGLTGFIKAMMAILQERHNPVELARYFTWLAVQIDGGNPRAKQLSNSLLEAPQLGLLAEVSVHGVAASCKGEIWCETDDEKPLVEVHAVRHWSALSSRRSTTVHGYAHGPDGILGRVVRQTDGAQGAVSVWPTPCRCEHDACLVAVQGNRERCCKDGRANRIRSWQPG